jgi:hypothetical protein
MAIIKVTAYPGHIAVLQAVEGINDLHAVMISPLGGVAEATSGQGWRGVGIARGTVLSGQLARVMTHGIISGVICAAAVQAGDRLTAEGNTSGPGLASGPGLVTPFNTITPAGSLGGNSLVSGLQAASGIISGIATIVSGTFTGTAFNTGRVLGRALTSGGVGSGIQMYVCVE